MNDTICINIKCNLNLWDATWGWWQPYQVKLTEWVVICSHFALTLEHLDSDLSLVISGCREDLRFLGWNGCVARNQLGHDATQCLNTERQWGHIKQENILHISTEYTSLNSSTHSDNFIRIH
mmetsp:Transcript_10428/g.20620  ORF Transcript_10428/g.20620 Transcript_10428/m.20620 type:complete len:122 (-) Transcript_10428:541-906(-)